MKIWRLANPDDPSFARATRHGTWRDLADGVCPECTASRQERVPPLVMSFDAGSDRLGDFIWPGMSGEIVLGLAAVNTLRRFGGFDPTPVHLIADKTAKVAELPATEPLLFELTTTRRVELDAVQSGATRETLCHTCGAETWDLDGIEAIASRYDPSRRQLVRRRVPRAPSKGLVVSRGDLAGDGVFRTNQCPAWICCTDPVREACRVAELTNIDFFELGDAV